MARYKHGSWAWAFQAAFSVAKRTGRRQRVWKDQDGWWKREAVNSVSLWDRM